jgi:hypothetical protein
MFNPILVKYSVSMLPWAVALVVATRVTNFIYPGGNMVACLGLAESTDIKSALKNGWAVGICQSIFLIIYAFLFS